MVAGLALAAAGPPGVEPVVGADRTLRLDYPGKPWSLTAKLEGFEFGEPRLSDADDVVAIAGYDAESELLITIRLEPAVLPGDASVCRDHHWRLIKERHTTIRGVKLSERGSMAVVEFITPALEGISAEQKQVHGYLVVDGVWIDIHLSTAVFELEDELLLSRILRRFEVEW
jgi:hypothetical protein